MDIYAFTSHYPNIYKPYYDYHFSDLIRRGHNLRVFSQGPASDRVSETFRAVGLDERITNYNPDDLRSLVRYLPEAVRAGIGTYAASRERFAPSGARWSLKKRLKESTRFVVLPESPPDISIVHSHETMQLFTWLREKYPASPVGLYYYGGIPKEAGSLTPELVRSTFEAADVVFVPSSYAGGEAREKGCSADKIEVLPLAFDITDFDVPEKRRYRPDGILRLMTVARLSEGKGHEYVLQALASIKERRPDFDFQYRVVGGGTRSAELRRLVRSSGLQNHVEFLGGVPFETVRELYLRTDAHILASHSTDAWTETQGTVIQEAMLMGAIPITTSTGGVPESIPSYMEQFQVEPRSAEELRRVIVEVGEMDSDSLRHLADTGRRWVEENFQIEDFNERLIKCLTERDRS